MSKELVSYHHIYNNPMYTHIKTSPNKLKKLKRDGLIEVITDSKGKDKVILSSLEKYVQEEKKVFEQCFTIGQAARKLISHKYRFKSEFNLGPYKNNIFNLMNLGILKSITFANETYITKESINQFLLDYISHEEALEKLNAGNITFWKILKRNNVNNIYLSKYHIFHPRQIVESLIEEYNQNVLPDNTVGMGTLIRGKIYDTERYYSSNEARNLLNLTSSQWKKLRKEENLTETFLGGIRHYLKEPIDKLRDQQQKLKAEYYISDEVQELLGLQHHSYHSKIINARKKVPTVFRGIHPQRRIEYIYPKSIVIEIVQENEIRKVVTSLLDNIDAYEYSLNSLKISFHNSDSFTCKEWKKFVHYVLLNTSESVETIHYTIFRYAKCTRILTDFLKDKEIYELTSNQINLALFNENNPIMYQQIFYSFINSIYNLIVKNKKKQFKMERILNPRQKEIIHKEKEIYDYEDYKSLFNFSTNLPLHKMKAIEDVKKQINRAAIAQNTSDKIKRQRTFNYDSSWLYVLLHLNNAWRHKDVIRFPKINLNDLSVPNINLEWLEQNNLSFEDARRIIQQVMRKDLRATKTNATNHFFCSKDVTLSLATAAVICELRRAATTPNYEYLINFNSIRNEFTSSMGFEEAADHMFKLDAQLLPSKEDHVQCLTGLENCVKRNIACRNCPMSVPNFYALSSLAESLITRVQQLASLEKQEYEAEKTKIANTFSLEMDQWMRATEKFGKEVIYKFVEGGSPALKEKMKQISVAELNKYKTYNINKSGVYTDED